MATPNQIAANQANSQKSTGPRTDAGKAKSALNHLSHGFASATAHVIPGENHDEFTALLADLLNEHQPATPTEQIYVERMAQNQWASLRAFRLQTSSLCGRGYGVPSITPALGLLIRYQTSADRAFDRAHTELVKAQKERKKSEIGFDSQKPAQAVAPPPANPQNSPKSTPFDPAPAPLIVNQAPGIPISSPQVVKKAA